MKKFNKLSVNYRIINEYRLLDLRVMHILFLVNLVSNANNSSSEWKYE